MPGVYKWDAPQIESVESIHCLFMRVEEFIAEDELASWSLIVDASKSEPTTKEVLKYIKSRIIDLEIQPSHIGFIIGRNPHTAALVETTNRALLGSHFNFYQDEFEAMQAISEIKPHQNIRLSWILKREIRKRIHSFYYTCFGILFGFMFPLLASFVLAYENGTDLVEAHSRAGLLILIIDTAPIFLGFFAFFAGSRQDDLERIKRKQNDLILQKESDMAKLISSSQSEIYLFNSGSSRFDVVNDAARENLGFSADELINMKPWDIMPEYSQEKFIDTLKTLKTATKQKLKFTTPHRRKNGTIYPAEVHLELIEYSGKPTFMAIVLDQTENEQLQRQVLHNSKLVSIGQLAAGVGHEINNPLMIADANVARIVKESSANSRSKEDINIAYEKYRLASDRIKNIVLGLKDFSREDQKEVQVFDLTKIIDQTVSLIAEIYEKDGITLTNSSRNPEINLRGNPGRIQQVLMNLITNAKDAVVDSPTKTIDVFVKKIESNVVLTVTDSGVGIPKSVQEKIFDAFFTTKDIGRGTGIGLSLTAAIIKEHEGTIEFESEPGHTVFRMLFPLAKESVATIDIQRPPPLTPAPGRVLVVDDEADIREILREILEGLGCTVSEANSGQEALEKISSGSYDYMFTDMKMPGMNGIQLVQNIHSLNLNHLPKIIVVTGGVFLDSSSNEMQVLMSLVDDFLLKPFDLQRIERLISTPVAEAVTAITA